MSWCGELSRSPRWSTTRGWPEATRPNRGESTTPPLSIALVELNGVRTQHSVSFGGMCPGLDVVFAFFEDAVRNERWIKQIVQDVSLVVVEQGQQEMSPSTPAHTATPISTLITSARNAIVVGTVGGVSYPRITAVAEENICFLGDGSGARVTYPTSHPHHDGVPCQG